MSEIVLIHGIGQEQETADGLEAKWLPALAGGIRTSGDTELADRIWRNRYRSDAIDVRMAAYGDLFLNPDAQGSDDDLDDDVLDELEPVQLVLLERLSTEWLMRASERKDHPDHKAAVLELGYLDPSHEEMGSREEAARTLLNAATRLRWFGLGAMNVATSVKKSLWQVTKYMTDSHLRQQIHSRVLAHVGPETKVIIGHSLGSVVAYEIAVSHLTNTTLPLLLTLGSPLGLRSIIYDRLAPQPPEYPARAMRWVNIADRNDLIAAEPDLTRLFERHRPAGAILESGWTVDNGAKPHEGEYYLGKREVGKPIAETLRN